MVQLPTHSTAATLNSFISTRLGVGPRNVNVNGDMDAKWTMSEVMEEGLGVSGLDSRVSGLDSVISGSDSVISGSDSAMPPLDSPWTSELQENADSSALNSTLHLNTTTPDACSNSIQTHNTHSHDSWKTKAGDLLDQLSVPSVAMVTQCDQSKP